MCPPVFKYKQEQDHPTPSYRENCKVELSREETVRGRYISTHPEEKHKVIFKKGNEVFEGIGNVTDNRKVTVLEQRPVRDPTERGLAEIMLGGLQ